MRNNSLQKQVNVTFCGVFNHLALHEVECSPDNVDIPLRGER